MELTMATFRHPHRSRFDGQKRSFNYTCQLAAQSQLGPIAPIGPLNAPETGYSPRSFPETAFYSHAPEWNLFGSTRQFESMKVFPRASRDASSTRTRNPWSHTRITLVRMTVARLESEIFHSDLRGECRSSSVPTINIRLMPLRQLTELAHTLVRAPEKMAP